MHTHSTLLPHPAPACSPRRENIHTHSMHTCPFPPHHSTHPAPLRRPPHLPLPHFAPRHHLPRPPRHECLQHVRVAHHVYDADQRSTFRHQGLQLQGGCRGGVVMDGTSSMLVAMGAAYGRGRSTMPSILTIITDNQPLILPHPITPPPPPPPPLLLQSIDEPSQPRIPHTLNHLLPSTPSSPPFPPHLLLQSVDDHLPKEHRQPSPLLLSLSWLLPPITPSPFPAVGR